MINLWNKIINAMRTFNNIKIYFFSIKNINIIYKELGVLQTVSYTFSIFLMIFLIFMIGAVFCGFFQCMLYRKNKKIKLSLAWSFCDNCGKTLRWIDPISFLNYIILRGRCRYCKIKIPIKYFYSEITSGIIMAALILSHIPIGYTFLLALFLVFTNSYNLLFNRINLFLTSIFVFFISIYIILFGINPINAIVSLFTILVPGLLNCFIFKKKVPPVMFIFLLTFSLIITPPGALAGAALLISAAIYLRCDKKNRFKKYLITIDVDENTFFFTVVNICYVLTMALTSLS